MKSPVFVSDRAIAASMAIHRARAPDAASVRTAAKRRTAGAEVFVSRGMTALRRQGKDVGDRRCGGRRGRNGPNRSIRSSQREAVWGGRNSTGDAWRPTPPNRSRRMSARSRPHRDVGGVPSMVGERQGPRPPPSAPDARSRSRCRPRVRPPGRPGKKKAARPKTLSPMRRGPHPPLHPASPPRRASSPCPSPDAAATATNRSPPTGSRRPRPCRSS